MQPPTAPGMAGPDDPAQALDDPHAGAVNRLRVYLAASFPDQFESHVAAGDTDPVSLAVRLMDRLALHPGTGVTPCRVTHCTRPLGHIGDHSAS